MRKYRTLKRIYPLIDINGIIEQTKNGYCHKLHDGISWIGLPSFIVEGNPDWFEEIKEPSLTEMSDKEFRQEILKSLKQLTDFFAKGEGK